MQDDFAAFLGALDEMEVSFVLAGSCRKGLFELSARVVGNLMPSDVNMLKDPALTAAAASCFSLLLSPMSNYKVSLH